MVPRARFRPAGRLTVGIVLLGSALAVAAGRREDPQLKIGERLMDGANAVKAADFKSGAELFKCADDGCVAVRAGNFTYIAEGADRSGTVLTPSVRVTAELGGKAKELAGSLAFGPDGLAKIDVPAGAKVTLEPINFFEAKPGEAAGNSPQVVWGDYRVELNQVQIRLAVKPGADKLARGERSMIAWSVENSNLLPEEARVELVANAENGMSPAAFRVGKGMWQDRVAGLPLSGKIETMFLSPGMRDLVVKVLVSDITLLESKVHFQVSDPKLRLEVKNLGRRVGDVAEVAAYAGDQPLEGASLALDADGKNGRVALNDALRAIGGRYDLFRGEARAPEAKFATTELPIEPISVEAPLPQVQSVSFRNGLNAQVEPYRPTILPIVLKAEGGREIDADPVDLGAIEVVQDPPGALSAIRVVTTGSNALGLSFTAEKPKSSVTLTVKYRGRAISTLIVSVDPSVKSGRLVGKFLPLDDEDVKRIYGDEVAKAYHVIECTLTNTTEGDGGDGKSDVIVQPESLEFGAVVQSRTKKGNWQIASAAATSAAILPGGSLGATGFSIGSILEPDSLRDFFKNAGRNNSPTVVKLMANHLPKDLPEDPEHWANALNTAVADLVASTDWAAFAAAYGYTDPGLQTPERARLVRRRLQIDTNEAVIGDAFDYLRWRPLSAEAVNEVFQVLARRKRESKAMKVAQLFLSAGRVVGNVGLIGDAGKGIVSGLGSATGLLPTIKQTLPELSDARRRTLASMLFAGPLRLAPQVPTKKHIFISKEVMKYMFNAEETRITEVVQGSMTADVAIVTSSERTTIGSSGG